MGVIWNASVYPWWRGAAGQAPHAVSIVTEPPLEELLTLEQAKLRAGLSWADGDPRDELMDAFIAAARGKVEADTGLSLLEQTRAIYFDAIPPASVITLPVGSLPLQEVVSIETIDTAGVSAVVPAASYVVDYASGRIALAAGASWPSNLRTFQAWLITIIAGWPTPADLLAAAPALYQAVGLLTAHYATAGRDLAITGTIVAVNVEGYDELLAAFRPVTVI